MRIRCRKIILGMMAVLSAAAITSCGTQTVKDSDLVMEIEGQPVVKAEYQMILENYVAQVKGQYTTDQANQKDFWTMKQGDGTPLEQIMELAQQELVHKKVVAQLAENVGIEKKSDYLSMMQELELENDNREAKSADGQTVYGLTSFTAKDYYTYTYTEIEGQLLENLKEDQQITEQELKKIYQENIEQYTSDISVQMLIAEMRVELGIDQAQEVAEEMGEETNEELLVQKYPDVNFYQIKMTSLNTEEGKSGAYTMRWMTASAMQQGEICQPFQIGDHLMVMRCLARTENSPESFEAVKGVLKSDVLTDKAQQKISSQEQKAEVVLKIEQRQLESIALEALE